MAAVELATGYISLAVSTKGLGNQISREFSGVEKKAERSGQSGGKKLGTGLLAGVKGIAGPIAALFAVGKVVDFFKSANAEARESEKVGKRTTNVIKTTGGAAKVTAKQVGALSTAISNKTGIDDEAVQSGANLLLTFTKVRNEAGKGNDIFNQATQTVQDMSVAFDQSGKASAIQLGKALQDPIKGVTALARVGVQFTDQQKKQIKTLVESGNILGAQKIILGELKTQVGGAAAATATGTEKMQVGWANLKEQIGTQFLPVIDKVAGFIATKIIPALSKFVSFVSTNIGPAFAVIGNSAHGFIEAFKGEGTTSNGVVGFFERLGVSARGLIPVLQQVGNFVQTTLLPALVSLGRFIITVVLPAWIQWQQFMVSQLLPVIRQLGTFFLTSIVPALRVVVGFIITQLVPGFLSIVSTVKGLIAVVAPIIGQLVAAILGKFNEMKPQIMSIWNSVKDIITGVMFIVREVIQAVTTVISLIWSKWGKQITSVVTTVFGGIVDIIGGVLKTVAGVIKLLVALIKGDWSGAWNAIKQIFAGVWQAIKGILTVATAGLRVTLQIWWDKVKSLFNAGASFVKGVWNSFWGTIKRVGGDAINAVRTTISNVLGKIRDAFSTAVKNIGKVWDGLKAAARKPVEFVVNTVINNGLIRAYNAIAGAVGGKKLPSVSMAGGGILPGYTPGRDVHEFYSPTAGRLRLSGGEGIARPELAAAIGKKRWAAANAAAARGDTASGLRYLGGYKSGGIIPTIGSFTSKAQAALSKLSQLGGTDWAGLLKAGAGNLVASMKTKLKDMLASFAKSIGGGIIAGLKGFAGGGGSNRAIGKRMMLAAGWGAGQWPALNALWTRESGWNTHALNRSSGAYGIPQSLPASKMASAGSDWRNNPATQIRWGLSYIRSRYGSPGGAWAHSQRTGWYDKGGMLEPGWTLAYNGTGQPERVIAPDGSGGGGVTINGDIHGYSAEDVATEILKLQRKQQALQPSYV